MPEVTVHVRVVRVLCTTVGETATDLLNEKAGIALAIVEKTNLGYRVSAVLFLAVILALVVHLVVPRKDVTEERAVRPS